MKKKIHMIVEGRAWRALHEPARASIARRWRTASFPLDVLAGSMLDFVRDQGGKWRAS